MSDFLFHNVSEKEREEIKKEAKKIMENFSEKLSKVKKNIPEPLIERENYERNEESIKKENKSFKKIMFENAPNKNSDFILTEKKKW